MRPCISESTSVTSKENVKGLRKVNKKNEWIREERDEEKCKERHFEVYFIFQSCGREASDTRLFAS
jgi:hypothetical protein